MHKSNNRNKNKSCMLIPNCSLFIWKSHPSYQKHCIHEMREFSYNSSLNSHCFRETCILASALCLHITLPTLTVQKQCSKNPLIAPKNMYRSNSSHSESDFVGATNFFYCCLMYFQIEMVILGGYALPHKLL